MADTLLRAAPSRHTARPASSPTSLEFKIRSVRPSLVDWRFNGDAWIENGGNGQLALCLGDYEMTHIVGLALDLPSLNQILQNIWNKRPRRH
ncbi:MAG TPA: hypothetical protein VK395_27480 [Gemmataceae bacterium]|nr:hypothetical protein [Gemmataceae bacterium]